MSVRATERLIGDVIIVSALPKSPQMVAKAVNEETKIVTAAWFSNNNEYQEGAFPASSLDRVDAKKTPQPKKAAPKKTAKKTKN